MKRTLLLIVALLVPGILAAGTVGKISGRIIDRETQEPLVGATVMLEGTSMGAATDRNGNFYILNVPAGSYNMLARMMGYGEQKVQNVRVNADLTTEIDFKLSTTDLLGEEVVVVAVRPLLQKDVTATQNIVRGEEIQASAVNSFTGAMVQTAGFVVQGVGEGGAVNDDEGGGIHVRGGRGGQLGYMIDGFYVEDALYGGLGSDVTRNGIEELSVLTGTFNAEYGEALSGVINLVTKEGAQNYEGSIRYATDELRIGALGDVRENNWHTRRYEYSLGGPVPGLGNNFRFHASLDRHLTNTYLNVTKHELAKNATVFGRPDSIATLHLDENDVVQAFAGPNTHPQLQKAGAVHYHNNNTYNFQYRGNAKLTFAPSPKMKLILGGTLTQQQYKNFSQYFKFLPEHANRNEIE
ncbi:carboxypeptidase-like regulatory domain-containing protein, partial [candidate division KSB1 bacterium]|nr:carboxypeptidase-like regulatory domain-containing protein [candidate division KSB1 bacterium]